MPTRPFCRWLNLVAIVSATSLAATTLRADEPATVAQSVQVIDFRKVPLSPGAQPDPRQTSVSLDYKANAGTKVAFTFHQKQLAAAGWKEAPGAQVSDESAYATFQKDGYAVSLTAFPSGMPNEVNLYAKNHGNVALADLPAPPGAKPFYSGPVSLMLLTESAVDATQKAVREALLAKGWSPYGVAGDQAMFKKNAVRLSAFITAAPAQDGKTMVTYSTEMMSVEIPAPADAANVHYSENPAGLFADVSLPQPETVAWFQKELATTGWKSTTENPVKESFTEWMIFRNQAGDLINMELRAVDGKTRVTIKHQSAAELAAIEKLIQEKKAKKK